MSVITAISGTASLMARVARFERLSGFQASSQSLGFEFEAVDIGKKADRRDAKIGGLARRA